MVVRMQKEYRATNYVMSALECKPNVSGESTIGRESMNVLYSSTVLHRGIL